MNLRIKRAYEPARPEDGERYLADRLWPRGVKRKTLVPIRWLKEVAPSDAIRSTSLEQADHLARKILELGTIQEANEHLHNAKAWRQ